MRLCFGASLHELLVRLKVDILSLSASASLLEPLSKSEERIFLLGGWEHMAHQDSMGQGFMDTHKSQAIPVCDRSWLSWSLFPRDFSIAPWCCFTPVAEAEAHLNNDCLAVLWKYDFQRFSLLF